MPGVELERVHPLHAVVRIAEHDPHRRLTDDCDCRLVGGYGDASERIEELDRPRQHRQPGRAGSVDVELPRGAADRGSRGRRLKLKPVRNALGLRPCAAKLEAQRRRFACAAGDAFYLQQRILVQADLGFVGKDQRHFARGSGAHEGPRR